ncbi:hypothetical protein ASD02_10910 [Ensifer sp. Root1252]|nr:hypothetical protein ASD02_10910 [Ensifer sp. Root1252]KRC74652.1 hypothetical protein ASE32_06995 [Ensifer sp. Root231]KRC94738.1 hypothetical protein ASE47_07985 [Ensifer sp. Root258]
MLANASVEDRPEHGIVADAAVEVVNDRPYQLFGHAGWKQCRKHGLPTDALWFAIPYSAARLIRRAKVAVAL